MSPALIVPSRRRRLIEILLTAVGYHLTAQMALLLQILGTNTTPVWPPSGIAFAALLLCGYRIWPGIFLGALGANLVGFMLSRGLPFGEGLLVSLPIAVGNTLEGVIGLALLRRFVRTSHPFERGRNVFGFLSVVPVMCTVAATIGVTTLCLNGIAEWSNSGVIWFTWWLGDATGVLVVTSLIVAWVRPPMPHGDAHSRSEVVLLVTSLIVACGLIFGVPFDTPLSRLPLSFLLLPLFVWSAYRFEHRGATLAITAASAFSIWATVVDVGPFAGATQNESLLLVQGFVAMVAITTLVLATEAHQRRRASDMIRASHEALLQSSKMEAVGRLAGGIAHDFNNILQVILGHASLLPKTERAAARIEGAVEKASGLVRQLLAYSRQQVLDPCDLDLNTLVQETGNLLRPFIGEPIEMEIRAHHQGLAVHADRSNIERVLLNLALNSRDAMPGGGSITIETGACVVDAERARQWDISPGPYATVTVRDTGTGMDEATLANIFDPFFTTKQTESRAGLGLATVYGIVRQSGGHIDVSSEPGRGTCFRVFLPRVEEIRDPTPSPIPLPISHTASGTILLAEDNAEVRELISSALVKSGYQVVSTRDGLDAQRLYDKNRSEIVAVVTDVVMPRMTGTALTHWVRERDPDVKVLLISGYNEDISLPLPGTANLQKPFTAQALLAKLGELLNN